MSQTTVIGPAMQQIIATQYLLYGVDAHGTIQQYQNQPNQWLAIGSAGVALATDGEILFKLDAGGKVYQFQGSPNQWLQIGSNMQSLAAGGEQLYARAAGSGNVMMYEGEVDAWTQIGAPVDQLVANGEHLFALINQGGQVLSYQPEPSAWVAIGSNFISLYLAGNALYALGSDEVCLYRYQGSGDTWVQVGAGWNQFAYVGLSLFAIAKDGSVVGEFDGTPGAWKPFSNDADIITADAKYVYLGNSQNLRQIDPQLGQNDLVAPGKAPAIRSLSAASWHTWTWSFETKNEAFAGYDGEISLTLYQSLSQQSLTLPRTHFVRGNTYHMQMDVASGFTALDTLSIRGQDNFFGDQWHLGKVTAFDPSTFKLYTFLFDTDVPNSGSVARNPASVKTAHAAPGIATVFVWNYLGKDVAWGHASIELDDGTYISWWPQGQNRNSMPLLPQIYSVDAVENQTFAADVYLEDNHQPDWRVAVGGLNHDQIRSWWNSFKTSHQWSTLSQNCSTTVSDALWAGGASHILTSRENDNFDSIIVWTPDDVLSFAQAIDTHLI